MNWFCAQIGAREHYAVARALQQEDKLTALYTDFWAGPITRHVAFGKLRSLATRWHPDPARKNSRAEIVSWNFRALWWEILLRRYRSEARFNTPSANCSAASPYHGYIEVGRRFAKRVQEDLKRRKGLHANSILYAYDTGALEAFTWARGQDLKCVLNQMDPNRFEVDLVKAEEREWPGWALKSIQVPEEYFIRREQEWALADRIVVNSEFSRQAIQQQGVPADKLVVIPLCYEIDESNRKPEIRSRKSDHPLQVLFLGQVILRKGIQYLMAAARQLENENIRFNIIGPVGISTEAAAGAPRNMTFHGRMNRDQTANWYKKSHLFVLPTLSDGFAITQLEAMAHGLPVVATPCCGKVIDNGVDGFTIAARDAEALAQTFRRYLSEPDLLPSQSAAALIKAQQFNLKRLGENLKHLETDLKHAH